MLLPNDAYHDDGTWKISLPLLLKNKQDTMRPDKWLASSQDRRSGYPSEVAEVCSPALLSGELKTKTEWITVFDALALLTYGAYNYKNQILIEEIERKTRSKLPIQWHYSKHEAAFGADLSKLLSDWQKDWQKNGRVYYEMRPQKKIYRYFVDFLITKKTNAVDGSTLETVFIMEFDEDAHKRADYAAKDEERDTWFRKNKPDHTIIRVRHEHQDEWFEVVRKLGRLVSLDSCYAKCLWIASTDVSKGRYELLINSQSSPVAYDENANDCSFLLKQPERRLAELKGILKRLDIEATRESAKIVRFKRQDVEKYL